MTNSKIIFNEIPEKELENALDNFYLNPIYAQFNALRYKENKHFLDIVGKTNSETIHSNFIKWLFENNSFIKGDFAPLKTLLHLAIRKAQESQIICDETVSEEELKKWIRTNQIKSLNAKIEREYPVKVKNDPDNKENRKVDLLIEGIIKLKDPATDEYSLRIIIENKIRTFEHDLQCRAYEQYFLNEVEKSKRSNITIFIFLAPYSVSQGELSSPHFISLEYQNLYDFILLPLSRATHTMEKESANHLESYIKLLTSMETTPPIAVSDEYKELLKQFFDENRDLILTAMRYCDEPDVQTLVNSAKVQSAKNAFKVIINNNESSEFDTNADLVYFIIKHIASSAKFKDADQMVEEFEEIGKIYSSQYLLSLTEPRDKAGIPNNRHLAAVKKRERILYDGKEIFVSNQLNGKGSDKDNITPFIDFINANHEEFGVKIESE